MANKKITLFLAFALLSAMIYVGFSRMDNQKESIEIVSRRIIEIREGEEVKVFKASEASADEVIDVVHNLQPSPGDVVCGYFSYLYTYHIYNDKGLLAYIYDNLIPRKLRDEFEKMGGLDRFEQMIRKLGIPQYDLARVVERIVTQKRVALVDVAAQEDPGVQEFVMYWDRKEGGWRMGLQLSPDGLGLRYSSVDGIKLSDEYEPYSKK